jgi:hypothetical protein
MPCPSHPPWLDHSNYAWRRVLHESHRIGTNPINRKKKKGQGPSWTTALAEEEEFIFPMNGSYPAHLILLGGPLVRATVYKCSSDSHFPCQFCPSAPKHA